MNVNEIFATIEGETTLTGMPMLFIRFTGCPLRCSFCDTTYAYEEGTTYDVQELVDIAADHGLDTVHLTGGEPLIQSDLPDLVERLLAAGHRVVIETGGSQDIGPYVQPGVHIMLDIKTPGSLMQGHNLVSNYTKMRSGIDEFKFVVCDRDDFEWTLKTIQEQHLDQTGCTINLSPVFPALQPRTLAAWILEQRLPLRLNCQMHKFIWPEKTRGV